MESTYLQQIKTLFDEWPKEESDEIDKEYFKKITLLAAKAFQEDELNWQTASGWILNAILQTSEKVMNTPIISDIFDIVSDLDLPEDMIRKKHGDPIQYWQQAISLIHKL